MDGARFDRVAQDLAGRIGRRSALALLGAAAASIAGRLPMVAGAAGNGDRPGPAGVCGPRKQRGNACRSDADCCTRNCVTDLDNRDGLGRCRCVRAGGDCSGGRTCCGRLRCTSGVCSSSRENPPPPAAVCNAATCPTGCCQGTTCLAGTEVTACGTGGLACVDCGQELCIDQVCDPCSYPGSPGLC